MTNRDGIPILAVLLLFKKCFETNAVLQMCLLRTTPKVNRDLTVTNRDRMSPHSSVLSLSVIEQQKRNRTQQKKAQVW